MCYQCSGCGKCMGLNTDPDTLVCPRCKTSSPVGTKFCPKCNMYLKQPAGSGGFSSFKEHKKEN